MPALPAPTRTSGRVLVGDLARSEVQLSDWTHCASAATPQGKEKIAEISAKVDAIKAKMQAAEQAASAEAATPANDNAKTLGATLDVYA